MDWFISIISTQWWTSKGLLKRDLAEDGLHPNRAGYTIMAPLAEKAIERTLAGKP